MSEEMNSQYEETVAAARARVTDQAWSPEGAVCPCCQQYVKVYRRTITGSMARALLELYWWFRTQSGDEYRDVASHFTRLVGTGKMTMGGDWAKLRFWGLLEEQTGDAGPTGKWRLTPTGTAFVTGTARVQKYALVLRGECLGMEGPMVAFLDVNRASFSLEDAKETERAPDAKV